MVNSYTMNLPSNLTKQVTFTDHDLDLGEIGGNAAGRRRDDATEKGDVEIWRDFLGGV